jgi:hypothetical protein
MIYKKERVKHFGIWLSDFWLWQHVSGLLSLLVCRKFVSTRILNLMNNRIITNGKGPLETKGIEFLLRLHSTYTFCLSPFRISSHSIRVQLCVLALHQRSYSSGFHMTHCWWRSCPLGKLGKSSFTYKHDVHSQRTSPIHIIQIPLMWRSRWLIQRYSKPASYYKYCYRVVCPM